MKECIDTLLNEYLQDESYLVDSNKNYYQKFIKELPDYLYKYFDNNKYLIKSSVGATRKSAIPWLCIFNKSITTSAQSGIYICILFRKDMSGFYLAIGQGITKFKNFYEKDKYKNISKVANYFKTFINSDYFSKETIYLKSNNELAKGYIHGIVISKYYDKNNYLENNLLKDLIALKKIYDEIYENLKDESYWNIVNNVIQNMEPSFINVEEANKIIEDVILKEDKVMNLRQVDIPSRKEKHKHTKIENKIIKKIDYADKSKSNAENGLSGEKLVMDYEKNRLIELGRKDLAKQIKWVSEVSDSVGYDILSYDIIDNHVMTKYIEVKTTEGNDKSVFYISKNEIKTMKKYKEHYFIYRIFNLNKNPEVFIINYDDFFNKFKKSTYNYTVRIK